MSKHSRAQDNPRGIVIATNIILLKQLSRKLSQTLDEYRINTMEGDEEYSFERSESESHVSYTSYMGYFELYNVVSTQYRKSVRES